MENANIIISDWNDMLVRDNLMDTYGNSEEPFWGHNQDGESVTIHIAYDNIILETMQNNGWIRKNFYYYGEDMCEEIFTGRWR